MSSNIWNQYLIQEENFRSYLVDSVSDETDFLEEDLELILDSNLQKIFRAEMSALVRSSRTVPKPRKFVKSKQCLVHSDNISRYSKSSGVPKKLHVKFCTLDAAQRLKTQLDFHKNTREYVPPPFYGFGNGNNNTSFASIVGQPVYKKSKKFALVKAKNDLEKLLLELQTRDITPEDYDLLLELDSKVKAKTVEANKVAAIPDRKISVSSDSGSSDRDDGKPRPTCVICLEEMVNCMSKTLPCGHAFHSKCISRWLTENSRFCPVDQQPFDC